MGVDINDIILVEWIDSVEMTGWKMADELAEPMLYETETIGRLVKQNEAGIMVAGSSGKDQHCGIMCIPRLCINAIKKLKLEGGTK